MPKLDSDTVFIPELVQMATTPSTETDITGMLATANVCSKNTNATAVIPMWRNLQRKSLRDSMSSNASLEFSRENI
jgi:hypothetical protein